MFELFDQFLYLSIFLFGAYITLYVKSRSYSGLLLIVCSVLSNFLLFKIILDPFIFIALPITAVLLLNDFVQEYKLGYVNRKHKLGAMIAIAIIIYDAIFLVKIFNVHLIDSYNMFAFGSILGVLAGFYLIIYPFKELIKEREQNLELINQGIDPRSLLPEERLKLVSKNSMDNQNHQKHLAMNESNQVLEDKSSVETSNGTQGHSRQIRNDKVEIFGYQIDKLYLITGFAALVLIMIIVITSFVSRTVIDMEDYVFVTYDKTIPSDSPVSYYASFEHFDKNNFYDELITEGEEYGLTEAEIEKYTPVYTTEDTEMFNKLDIQIALSQETVNNGDIVTTNITYNEKYAMKNNIVIQNSNFDTKISDLPEYITNPTENDIEEMTKLANDALAQSSFVSKYKIDSSQVEWSEGSHEYFTLIGTYQVDGGFLNKGKEIKLEYTPYLVDGKLMVSPTINKI